MARRRLGTRTRAAGSESYEEIEHHPGARRTGRRNGLRTQSSDEMPTEPVRRDPAPRLARREEPDEFEYHTGTIRPTEEPDAIEFVEVHKSFGRNHVLRGPEHGDAREQDLDDPRTVGYRQVGLHQAHRRAALPRPGRRIVHGHSIPSLPDTELFELRKKFGVLFQDGALFGSMNLYDNVAFPLRQHTEKGEEEIAEIVNRRLSEVGLAAAGEKMPNELSGGMRKRAGFARALVMEPDIVLFDEPDSGLDPVRTALLCELIKEVHAENGGCYVVITHDIMSARRVAEHISVLWKGRIVETGPAAGSVRLRKSVRAAVPLRRVGRSARHGVGRSHVGCGSTALVEP